MEFNELIKNFERIRIYMKDFFVFGFKSRNEFTQKSARTYDNERRRVESYLKNYINYQQSGKEKSVFITVDHNSVFQNPLYAAWKSKSFTDNDILLHFYLLELLSLEKSATAEALANQISARFGADISPQIIRLKLKEYQQLGVLDCHKDGKKLCYHLSSPMLIEQQPEFTALLDSITFFQQAAPFGLIGSTILDHTETANKYFSYKHLFLMHTLDDAVLLDILQAIKHHQSVSFINKSHRRQSETVVSGIPLKILISTRTGRRYICIYYPRTRRYSNLRLDAISQVIAGEIIENFDALTDNLNHHLPNCWGVSFGGDNRQETIQFTLSINEMTEQYILKRLQREGRGGEIEHIGSNLFRYTGTFYDTNEALPWIKTFIGRINQISGSNHMVINKIKRDLDDLYDLYFPERKED